MKTNAKIEERLNDLIEIAKDGADFYHEAAEKVKNPELVTLFNRIAGVKTKIVTVLSAEVQSFGGKPASSGTVTGSFQQLYGKIRAAFGDTDYGYVAELEESEDRLLKAFKEVIADPDLPVNAKTQIEKLYPEVVETHNIMRSHKHALKK